MAAFVLVHGSCHGAWCWRDTIPALADLGHVARAVDLPGRGDDAAARDRATLADCAASVLAAATPDDIVVGHSWGGYPIGAAAATDPRAMRALVYLCAYVPVAGRSMIDLRKRGPRQTLTGAVTVAPDGASYTFDPGRAPDLFYPDCPQEAVDFAMTRLCPQAILPQSEPFPDLPDGGTPPPAHYIRCTRDRVIPPEYQAAMVTDWPRGHVHDLATSHSPFFADPAGLAAILHRIAGSL